MSDEEMFTWSQIGELVLLHNARRGDDSLISIVSWTPDSELRTHVRITVGELRRALQLDKQRQPTWVDRSEIL